MSTYLHQHATTLALLIMSEGMQPGYDTVNVHPAYTVIDRSILTSSMSDEARADLYSLIAESVNHRDPLMVVTRGVSDALFANERRYPRG